jgi:hypothetical protein
MERVKRELERMSAVPRMFELSGTLPSIWIIVTYRGRHMLVLMSGEIGVSDPNPAPTLILPSETFLPMANLTEWHHP